MDTKLPIPTHCILTWTEPTITPSGVINLSTKPTWNYPISAFKTLKFKTPLPTCSILIYALSVLILLYLSPAHSRPCQPSLQHGTEATLGNQLEWMHDKDIPLVTVVQFSVACLNKYPPHLTLRLKEWLLLYASVCMLPHQFFVLINKVTILENWKQIKDRNLSKYNLLLSVRIHAGYSLYLVKPLVLVGVKRDYKELFMSHSLKL
jgi:hypothetical protein